ncbi:heparanase-like [Littorina saxatilis]|uniref:Glycoside hydrolase family 79 n=1 Tax=Littorina saxatilis TaxID=31220 RepID=A0AAN9AM18_9CAEN
MFLQLTTILLHLALCSATKDVVHFSVNSAQGDRTPVKEDNSAAEMATVTVNLQQAVNRIGSHFVGVTIDSQQIRYNWNSFGFGSTKVQNMARALSPSYFRLGGSAADYMTFDPTNQKGHKGENLQGGQVYCSNFTTQFYMSVDQWDILNKFLQAVGWDFIMDLNALQRNADGSWNPANARQLLQYSASKNYKIAAFELGNEYNLYPSSLAVTPAQLAVDYVTLQNLLGEFPQDYYSSFLVGPETAMGGEEKYFLGFLQAGGYKTIRASSFHSYYFSAQEKYLPHFTNVSIMNYLGGKIELAMTQTRQVDPLLPVWLSETSTAYGCGTANMSDRFVAGFLWLDKLGLSAAMGIQSVIRQTFYGFNYGILDLDLNPNPDFWLTVLYKRIVRGPVFNATSDRSDVRAYVACANPDNFKAGSLAFYFLNPNDYSVTFDLPQFDAQTMLIYALTAGDSGGLLSKFSALNGMKLEMSGDNLPDLKPLSAPKGPVSMAPYSFGFVVLPEARVSICLNQ